MTTKGLERVMIDLSRLSEGEEVLHFRFRPGGSSYPVLGRKVTAEALRLSDTDGKAYHVGVARADGEEWIVTSRTWYEGYDEWEAAGRPSEASRRPRYVGTFGPAMRLSDGPPEAVAFAEALRGLHACYGFGGAGRADPERIDAAADAVEAAMRGIERVELRAAGVPEWLLTPEAEEGPAPRM
jgi:hypothetical protein